ncbi:hypothetical protein ACU4GD_11485 [Cupriavidus basilensis]
MQSLKVETHAKGLFDWEMTLSNLYYLRDLSRLSTGLYPGAQSGGPGRATDMSGTGWTTVDLKGTWRPQGAAGANIVSFGAHYDQFKLASPTYTTTNWTSGSSGPLFSNSLGKTQNQRAVAAGRLARGTHRAGHAGRALRMVARV